MGEDGLHRTATEAATGKKRAVLPEGRRQKVRELVRADPGGARACEDVAEEVCEPVWLILQQRSDLPVTCCAVRS